MKRLVSTRQQLYDAKGKFLGYAVVEIEAFTSEELEPTQCSECGGPNGVHREYFVKTGQHGGGDVYGYYQKCSRAV